MPDIQGWVFDLLFMPMIKLIIWTFKMAFAFIAWIFKTRLILFCLAAFFTLVVVGVPWWLGFRILAIIALWALCSWLFTLHIKRKRKKSRMITHPPAPDGLTADQPCGVFFGKQRKKYVVKPETVDGHILTVGGAGSGKSSCVAIPTLRAWKSSVFAIDIKGELQRETKDFRGNIKVFNPFDENSYGYDPYYFMKNSRNLAQEARAIAESLVPKPHDTKEPFWIEAAQSIFTAAILHDYSENLSFLETIKQIQSMPPTELIDTFRQSGVQAARYYIMNFVGMSEKTLSGVMSELSKNIVPFITDKNLTSCLSRENHITPDDLEMGGDIYIQIPEHLLNQWKPLLTLIVNQFLKHFEQRNEINSKPILFLLDEFPRLGKMPALLDGLATLRSKKITICLVIQSLAQLDLIYGRASREVIADTCAYTAILGATDANTQDYFSRRVGTYDKPKNSDSDQYGAYIKTKKGTTKGRTTEEKRIIKPEEFGTLQNIVLLTPKGFCRVDKAPYYLN